MEYHLAESLGYALHKTYMRMRVISTRRLRPHGLTPDQFGVLALLWDNPGLSQGDIARILVKDAPNVTRIVDRLEAKQLVERCSDPHDRRAYRVYPTRTGQAMHGKLGAEILQLRKELLQGLSDKEQDSLHKMLNKLFASMEQNHAG